MEQTFIARTGANGKLVGHFYVAWSLDAAQFMEENKFEKVLFEGRFGDMSFLSAYVDHIKEIVVTNEDRRAEGVAGLVNLRALTLKGKTKKPLDLSNLLMLERCYLIWDASYAETLFRLRHLESVYISGYSAQNFALVSENSSVKNLRLSNPEMVDFEGLGRFENLENLHIQKAGKLKSCDGISGPKSLRNIYVDSARKVVSTKEIGKVLNLEHLMLRHVGAADPNILGNLMALRFLAMPGTPVKPDWSELVRLPSLNDLTVLVDDEYAPSEEVIRTAAAAAGKTLISLVKHGKKQPLVHIRLEKN